MSELVPNQDASNAKNCYSSNDELCKLFRRDAASLYLLAFLLVANHEKAAQCFVFGLDGCLHSDSVFRDWAYSWARHVIIRRAVQIVEPHNQIARLKSNVFQTLNRPDSSMFVPEYEGFANILALEDFERFVFVLTILEEFPNKECAALLGASEIAVHEARIRSLLHVPGFESTLGPTSH